MSIYDAPNAPTQRANEVMVMVKPPSLPIAKQAARDWLCVNPSDARENERGRSVNTIFVSLVAG